MKAWILLLITALVLIGCARTQVIHLAAYNQSIPTAVSIKSQENITNISEKYNITGPLINHTITSCCQQGRMDVKVNAKESERTVNQIRDLMTAVYYENCEKFKGNEQHSLYLAFSEYAPGNVRNHIISYENSTHRVLVIKAQFYEPQFVNCLARN